MHGGPSCSAWYASNAAGKSKALLAAATHIVWASAPAILFFLLVCQPHAMNMNLCPTYMVLGIRSSTVEWSCIRFTFVLAWCCTDSCLYKFT